MPKALKASRARQASAAQARKVLQGHKENIQPTVQSGSGQSSSSGWVTRSQSGASESPEKVQKETLSLYKEQARVLLKENSHLRSERSGLLRKLQDAEADHLESAAHVKDLKDKNADLRQRATHAEDLKDENVDLWQWLHVLERRIQRLQRDNVKARIATRKKVAEVSSSEKDQNDSGYALPGREDALLATSQAYQAVGSLQLDLANLHEQAMNTIYTVVSEASARALDAEKALTDERNTSSFAVALYQEELCRVQYQVSAAISEAQITADNARSEAQDCIENFKCGLAASKAQGGYLTEALSASKATVYAFRKRCKRHPDVMARVVSKAVKKYVQESRIVRLKFKGVYTLAARMAARKLINFNVASEHIRDVFNTVAELLGVSIPPEDKMSRQTVRRAVLEGGVAAKLQVVFDIMQSEGFMISGDGTSHRHINYESNFIALSTPVYTTSSSSGPTGKAHRLRTLGVHSATNRKADTQVDGWKDLFSEFQEFYDCSPLSRRHQTIEMAEIARKLKGYFSNHAAYQKKTSRGMQDWKWDESLCDLGEDALLLKDVTKLVQILADANAAKIATVGGMEKWNLLSWDEQTVYKWLGEEVYAALSEEEKHKLDLYIWGGCCMHKDLNSFIGGNTRMTAWWLDNGVTPPVLLANKDNAAVLAGRSTTSDALTDTEKCALDSLTCGGVKTMDIGGAVFKNSDQKKGQGDSYAYRFGRRYPDTSNTRYHSHGDSACVTWAWLDDHIDFVLRMKECKANNTFTNMEKNLYNALQDPATLTEMACMVLYTQTVSEPYLKIVRGPGSEGLNQLDLGPFHEEVKTHIKMLIEDPDLVLAEDARPELATLDVADWAYPEAVHTIQQRASEMPYLRPVFVAFLSGALETWNRFTSEFKSGEIDKATEEDRALAWMPATNDHNEGALGSLPALPPKQAQCRAAFLQFTSDTFMDKMLVHEDFDFIRREACKLESRGLEKQHRQAQVDHEHMLEDPRRRKEAEKRRKLAEKAEKLAGILEVHRQLDGNQDMPKKSHLKNKAEKVAVLKHVVRHYLAKYPKSDGKWLEDMGIGIETDENSDADMYGTDGSDNEDEGDE
ncbi:hypothetical protein GLOTRDRAFT_96296 [Gloeophyllum trabeum ATCC 11539]|uniref:Uncharacterized protein n=1 Tax=Gloeophyllum trabeum (strain ATCC 11539 / FP-39264 / Madison 617) TaxID=670483 RepID=S7PVM9_GLOTA|nr:uncharacterized protein GLOTRDRAFT_96296 [Gloeophyllum trabeum ATCC 11539]EPQ51558.1 hypothetical protein GLOTRDRAFT_96296 [Gloeophyllum trabeum ATCC 11539]